MGPTDDTRVAEKPQRTYDQSSGATSSSSYKCYEGIPTPSPISPAGSNFVRNYVHSSQRSRSINHESEIDTLHRPASLDSLVNLPAEQATNIDDKFDRLSDSDSMAEICEITGETRVDIHRRSDLDDMQDVQPLDEPVIKAYLEKSHVQCEYKNCGFKKELSSSQSSIDVIQEDSELSTLFTATSSSSTLSTTNVQSSAKNRRNSIASSGSVGRMETIIEEPMEPKVSVKEILARFETLRESAEVIINLRIIIGITYHNENEN